MCLFYSVMHHTYSMLESLSRKKLDGWFFSPYCHFLQCPLSEVFASVWWHGLALIMALNYSPKRLQNWIALFSQFSNSGSLWNLQQLQTDGFSSKLKLCREYLGPGILSEVPLRAHTYRHSPLLCSNKNRKNKETDIHLTARAPWPCKIEAPDMESCWLITCDLPWEEQKGELLVKTCS